MECSDNPSDILSCSFFAADAAHLNCDRLDLAFQRPMERDFCLADLGETERPFQLLALLFYGELPAGLIGIGETIIAIAALETREPRIFAMLAPSKEVLKSLIKPS